MPGSRRAISVVPRTKYASASSGSAARVQLDQLHRTGVVLPVRGLQRIRRRSVPALAGRESDAAVGARVAIPSPARRA